MNFILQITPEQPNTFGLKEMTNIEINNTDISIKEIQKNKLTDLMVETKFVFECNSKQSFDKYLEQLTNITFNSFKLLDGTNEVLYEREQIESKDYSIFSSFTENDKKIEIIFFDYNN